jgi:protein TonB
MHIRYLVTASLMHGALVVGLGLGIHSLSSEPGVPPRVGVAIPEAAAPVPLEAEIEETLPPLEAEQEPEFVDPVEPPAPEPPRREKPVIDEPTPAAADRSTVPVPTDALLIAVVRKQEAPPPTPPAVAAPDVDAETLDEHNEPPRYPDPRRARRFGLEGTVVLLVSVDLAGNVTNVQVERSAGASVHHKALDRAAVVAVWKWRYKPARRAGEPVAARIRVPIEFRLR